MHSTLPSPVSHLPPRTYCVSTPDGRVSLPNLGRVHVQAPPVLTTLDALCSTRSVLTSGRASCSASASFLFSHSHPHPRRPHPRRPRPHALGGKRGTPRASPESLHSTSVAFAPKCDAPQRIHLHISISPSPVPVPVLLTSIHISSSAPRRIRVRVKAERRTSPDAKPKRVLPSDKNGLRSTRLRNIPAFLSLCTRTPSLPPSLRTRLHPHRTRSLRTVAPSQLGYLRTRINIASSLNIHIISNSIAETPTLAVVRPHPLNPSAQYARYTGYGDIRGRDKGCSASGYAYIYPKAKALYMYGDLSPRASGLVLDARGHPRCTPSLATPPLSLSSIPRHWMRWMQDDR
ncbi:hypothetical protein DFH09DRAFT_1434720 [Mycena vulgaris]|nr:hypothetical protein DFH09DRAFT_1434720 [Mycena vulgaris]